MPLKTGYDPVAGRWPDWIAGTGLQPECLPAVSEPGTPVGRVSVEAREKFGFGEATIVVAGTTDGCASFLATGACAPGEGVTALGSTLTLKLLSDRPIFAPEYGIYSHRVLGLWLAGGASNTGGNVLAHFFEPDELAELSRRISLDRPTGLDFYPLLSPGERFPICDPAWPPRLEPRPANRTVFLQAILEGVAGIEALGYRRLAELGGPPLCSVRTVGGGAANAAWRTIRARVLGVPLEAPLSEEAATGTARLALLGARRAGLL
jgi:sugar (pentulose or hexulose) kinase